MEKLKCCPVCGDPVEIKYICGFGGGIDKIVKNPFAGSMPTYYIQCDNCGKNMAVRLRMSTAQHRDKCKRDLIRAWNKLDRAVNRDG